MKEIGNADRQEAGRRLNNRAENSHQPFRRRERAMQRFRSMKTLQKFSSVHAQVHNHFNQERNLVTRQVYKQRRSAALAEWSALRPNRRLGLRLLRPMQTTCRCSDEAPPASSSSLGRVERAFLSPMQTFFNTNPELELLRQPVARYVLQHPDSLKGITTPRQLFLDELGAIQRIFRVAPQYEHVQALLAAAITRRARSAARAARCSEFSSSRRSAPPRPGRCTTAPRTSRP